MHIYNTRRGQCYWVRVTYVGSVSMKSLVGGIIIVFRCSKHGPSGVNMNNITFYPTQNLCRPREGGDVLQDW
jgi:hypothetical protein